MVGRMGNDAFKMLVQEPVEPKEMLITILLTQVHDPDDIPHHLGLVVPAVCKRQPFLDEVAGKQKRVRFKEFIVL